MTHPHPKRSFVPQAVLTRSGKLSTVGITVNTVRPVNTANTKAVNTVRPVNTANTKAVNTVRSVNIAASKPIVNHPRTKTSSFKRGYSQISKPFYKHFANKNSIINTNVNTARVKHTTARDRAVVSENKGKGANAVKASACWVWKAKRDYDGRFVSFGDSKGRISGKGKIKTGSLDFEDVYFCKELKYNLFSVSQICDKKNKVLFTDTECLVLSSDFKLLDESQVLMRVPRKDNIYSLPVVSGNKTNGITRTKDNTVAGQAQKEKEPEQEYIMIPIYPTDPSISQGLKDRERDTVYQLIEESILYGKIEEEYMSMSTTLILRTTLSKKVYKVEKHLWTTSGPKSMIQQKSDWILFISQDKYVAENLKKFDFASVKTASTLMEINKLLIKDEEAENVDVHLYRSMIGLLVYLTASRPDIMFVVCACAKLLQIFYTFML
ncbi:hypothetical protein Tco_0685861 [Tanacetum coccineum]